MISLQTFEDSSSNNLTRAAFQESLYFYVRFLINPPLSLFSTVVFSSPSTTIGITIRDKTKVSNKALKKNC